MTAPASIHPRTVENLIPDAKALTARLGKTPTRNQLMKELHIGAPKATALIEHLTAKPANIGSHPAPSIPTAAPVFDYPEPIGPDPAPTTAPADDFASAYANGQAVRRARAGYPVGPVDYSLIDVAREVGSAVAEPLTGPKQEPQVAVDGHPGSNITPDRPAAVPKVVVWPVMLLMLPAFVAVWAGWVGLGKYTGFGMVNLLPGIAPDGGYATIDSAITLPIGMEVYAAYALYVWLSGRVPPRARRFAMVSALIALTVGGAGQIAYHLLAAPPGAAPWWITTVVACLPVAVLGMGAALAHLVREDNPTGR